MQSKPTAQVRDFVVSNAGRLTLIAGPCVLEGRDHAFRIAEFLRGLTAALGVQLIFKASFDKANRTSMSGARGVGIMEGCRILHDISKRFDMPCLTDVHEAGQCDQVGGAVEVLQIPAFLCRQTDLLVAAATWGKVVNIKKGQFLAPQDIQHAVNKVRLSAKRCESVLVTERGASFGYNTLVNDFRALPIMEATASVPVIFDATHSVQQPGGKGGSSGGDRRFVPALARAAMAVGCAGLFVECHPDPDNAPSDGPNMLALTQMEPFLRDVMELRQVAQHRRCE